MTSTDPTALDAARMTRAQRAALPLTSDVAQALAEQHGVCIRPLAMRRIDTTTGRGRGVGGSGRLLGAATLGSSLTVCQTSASTLRVPTTRRSLRR
ncbi:MAG: hypothetical protein JO364_09280 [Pseudonocardiales bacterium]|nr:hypothetical protein [Pseudonocardiales bacterium]MBV9030487.1 hypothetical protein [Pseudonocardiales bacterium]